MEPTSRRGSIPFDGGGLHNNGAAPVELRHVTFSNNDAADDGDSINAVAGTTILRSSINPSQDDPCAGTGITSTGFNAAAIDDPDCNYIASDSTSGGLIGIQSGGPTDNGGFTDTIGLNAGGRAVDLVPAASCTDSQDQRGFSPPAPAATPVPTSESSATGPSRRALGAIDCPPPPIAGQPTAAPTPTPTPKKKCKKKKRKKAAGAAKKKGCKKKRKKR